MRLARNAGLAVATSLIGLAGVATPASSAELKVSGTVTYITDQTAKIPLKDGKVLTEANIKGVVLGAEATNPFHLGSQDCLGSSIVPGDGGPAEGVGTCVATNATGDAWWLSYHNKGDDRRWTVISGTGKFAGMTGSGTTKVLAATADGRFTISWTGTINLK